MYVVEPQLFSGRDNPRFVLTPAESGQVRSMLAGGLWGRATAPTTRSRLGDRGLVVYAADAAGSWLPWLHVIDGTVTVLVGVGSGTTSQRPAVEALLRQAAGRAGLASVMASSEEEPS